MAESKTGLAVPERYTPPCEKVESVLDIDFAEHVAEGRTTLLLDAESTFVEYYGWDVDEAITKKFQEVRELGIENIIIVTNKKPRYEEDLWQVEWWARQIGADMAFVPLHKSQRKPSPEMLLKALQAVGAKQEQALMVGDKLTGDAQAANDGGIYSIQVDRLGRLDHFGDRVARRPFEKLVGQLVAGNEVKPRFISDEDKERVAKYRATRVKPKTIEAPEYFAKHGLIVGYNDQELVELDIELAELIPATLSHKLPKLEFEWFNKLMLEHGGLAADAATYARLALGFIAAYHILRDNKAKATAAYVVGQITDLEGKLVRMSNEDPNSEHRRKMAVLEAEVDKVFSALVGGALMYKGKKRFRDYAVQQGREYVRGKQREHFGNKGYDTGATRSTKNGTLSLAMADFITIVGQGEKFSNRAQTLASAAKIWSLGYGVVEWEYKMKHKENAARVKTILEGQFVEAETENPATSIEAAG